MMTPVLTLQELVQLLLPLSCVAVQILDKHLVLNGWTCVEDAH